MTTGLVSTFCPREPASVLHRKPSVGMEWTPLTDDRRCRLQWTPTGRMNARADENVEFSMEQSFRVLPKADEIAQQTSSLHVDQEVDIAALEIFSPRTEPNRRTLRAP